VAVFLSKTRTLNLVEQLSCRDELRSARAVALADAEGFISIVHALELTGQLQTGKILNGLGNYGAGLTPKANSSVFATDIPTLFPQYHCAFETLFLTLCQARNNAVHEGVYARTLTEHAVEVALILEDALVANASSVTHFMVRNVVEAKPWHPISYIRQTMLKNAFSYLPLWNEDSWWLIPDHLLARHVRAPYENKSELIERLQAKIADVAGKAVILPSGNCVGPTALLSDVLDQINERPLLVIDPDRKGALLGLLTASDVL
jgi:CBS domain-containing protein